MVSKQLWSFFLVVAINVSAVVMPMGFLETSLALEQAGAEPMYLETLPQAPPNAPRFVAFFADDFVVEIMDLGGNLVGQGIHGGAVKCGGSRCNQRTDLSFGTASEESVVYEYRFTTNIAIDPEAERVTVGGNGTISSNGQKERFSFTATFQNNGDGTVLVTYLASRPDASFIIAAAPGTFHILGNP